MLVENYYSSAIPSPVEILGVKLRPLSLGHIVLLNRVECSLLSGEQIRYDDIAVALLICSRNFASGVAALDDPETPKMLGEWAQRITSTRPIDRILRRKPKPINMADAVAQFGKYIQDGSWHPNAVGTSDRRGEEIPLPSEQIVRVILMRELGFSEHELMDRSWSQCLTDVYTVRALDGVIKVMPDTDEISEFIEEAQQAINRVKANGNIS